MALLSNGNSLQLTSTTNTAPSTKTTNGNSNETNTTDHFLFSSILNTLPRWGDSLKVTSGPMNVPQNTYSHDLHNDEYMLGNSLGAIGSLPVHANHHDLLGGVSLTPSTSPQTSSSTSSHHCMSSLGAVCGRCDNNGTNRCLDCNDILCDDCVQLHQHNSFSRDHCIIPLATLSPIGSSANISNGSNGHNNDPQCDVHGEVLRYVCESCKKIVCQECTLWEHKDHSCIPIANVAENAKEQIQKVIESGKLGNKYIKASIDRAVQYSQAVERDALEASSRIRKAMRHFIMAAEERERVLLEKVDKYRQQKLTSLSDQMAGLRAALAGLAQTSEMLSKGLDSYGSLSAMDVVQTLTRGESQMEQFAAMYKNLQPKEEFISFITPNFELLQEIRIQGDVVMVNQRIGGSGNSITPPMIPPANNILTRRPIVRALTTPNQSRPISAWDQGPNGAKSMLSTSPNSMPSIGPIPGMAIIGQCIPGYHSQVSAKPSLGPSTSFAFDGHEDGQVSRPWGLCVDKDGNIIVADRRNNRIQVFYSDGTFKSKFGSKGTGNGQFDLPAGISTDPQNRIVVVDKDNHRVQIFTSTGIFILKFGSYGKDCGQFQYPWDIGVNSKGEMLVTDSRNHRIQLFNPDGHFISRFSFDGVNHSRSLKGLTTPRGVCFTPQGDVIISDFENHRLLLIDSTLTKILSTKGHEGNGIHEFSRPSGICCDDEGRVIVADSKNQRVLIFSSQLEFLWAIEIRPSSLPLMPTNVDEKDRPSDVALLPDGRLVVMVETSPDARDVCNPHKTFVQIY